MRPSLQRTVFETPRASEYFNIADLQALTGQPVTGFAAVGLKELVDNAIDACESAGVAPQIGIFVYTVDGVLMLSVTDNGAGIPAETVRRALNFTTRTSDKHGYRAPTRGIQGNALKTIFGMPAALGLPEAPIMITARGVRHGIRAWLDPAGSVRVEHDDRPVPLEPGTAITLTIPAERQQLDPLVWARKFALFNPHAAIRIWIPKHAGEHAQFSRDDIVDFYQPTMTFPGEWRKFLPTDLTSPWWYDLDALKFLIFAHINTANQGGRDLPLREFVRQFRGLSGTAKAKQVCDRLPAIRRLRDFEPRESAIADLHAAMRAVTVAPPSPQVLGLVGEEHIRTRFTTWYGVQRFWYRKVTEVCDGIPFVCEVAVAETNTPGAFYPGINFTATYDDPLADTTFTSSAFSAEGVLGFLRRAHAAPADFLLEAQGCYRAAVVHLIAPALTFRDMGKSHIDVPEAMVQHIAEALWSVTKELYREGERRQKGGGRPSVSTGAQHKLKIKEAVFAMLPEAYARGTNGERIPAYARDLFYEIRPLIEAYIDVDATLDFNYFSQNLLTEYRQKHRPLPLLYYKARGVLYEPHSGREIPLGTREVDSYTFPIWLYDKILYIEKAGMLEALKVARLAERYDMAIVAAEGYATEAVRLLFQHADQQQQYQLFVLHDADPDGYNIARTLRAATRRMPDHAVDVIDLGLRLTEALEMGLQTETFVRKKALPEELELGDIEQRYWAVGVEEQGRLVTKRVELNALPVRERAAYIERKLAGVGATAKVIPPNAALQRLGHEMHQEQISAAVDALLTHLLATDSLKQTMIEQLAPRLSLDQARQWIEQGFAQDSARSWRDVLARELWRRIDDDQEAIEAILRQHLRDILEQTRK
jgi:Histidine kinase-, DNA gyrase B-, and HSP90-like ATPase